MHLCSSRQLKESDQFDFSNEGNDKVCVPAQGSVMKSVVLFSNSLQYIMRGFLGGSMIRNPPANAAGAGDTSSIPGSGRSSGGGHGNPLQYSCLENSMERGAWRITKSQT